MSRLDPWTCEFADWMAAFEGADFEQTWREQLQWAKAREIAARRELIVSSGRAVLDAVADCARAGLTMPPWLADEFLRRHQAVAGFIAASWSDPSSFGPAHPALGRKPTTAQLRALEAQGRAAPALEWLFHPDRPGRLQRTSEGYKAAAKVLRKSGLSTKQIRMWLPKLKPHRRHPSKRRAIDTPTSDALKWANPFGVKSRK